MSIDYKANLLTGLVLGVLFAMSASIVYWGIFDRESTVIYNKDETEVITPVVERGGYLKIKIVYEKTRDCQVQKVTEFYTNTTTGDFKRYDRVLKGASNPNVRSTVDRVIVNAGKVTVFENIPIPLAWNPGEWTVYAESSFVNCTINPFINNEKITSHIVNFTVVNPK